MGRFCDKMSFVFAHNIKNKGVKKKPFSKKRKGLFYAKIFGVN